MIFPSLQTTTNISQFATKFLVPANSLLTTNDMSLKIVKNVGGSKFWEFTYQDVWDVLIKIIKSETNLGNIKSFSFQPIYIHLSVYLSEKIKYRNL